MCARVCGCAGGWKGCEAGAPPADMISTAPLALCSASQGHAQRVSLGNARHLAHASSFNSLPTVPVCNGLRRREDGVG